ncbi:MAG: isoleucine--tRNA ligase [Candidatus Moranbacteria bacterium]|nr:isoleucine--tRNA ligase [Candidatus Moranbacteria bacterium]
MFKKVDPKMTFPKMEEEVLKFWEENQVFEKSLEKNKDKQAYVFYDGPPFATGNPHYGHIVGSVMKDVVPRYWTMRGRYVERKWGWDCHGLPIENIAEKELGIKRKNEIEEMGVEKFNEFCRSKVLSYVSVWEKIITRLGRWADMKNAYKTMDLPYMESIWFVFKELWDKGLIYEGYRSMHICTRCETTLSQQEVSEGYKDIKDLSAIAKFELVDEPGAFVLAWTTTPWTLLGNVALAVGAEIDYVKISYNDKAGNAQQFILAKSIYEIKKDELFPSVKELKADEVPPMPPKIIEEFKGNNLVGKKYKPLFDYYVGKGIENEENGWQIYAGDFVTTEDGTGVVHIAPAFGDDDFRLSQQYNLPFVQHVGMDGIIKKEAGEFAGISLKPRAKDKPEEIREADLTMIKAMGDKIFHSEKYLHSYPHCWRCDTPLINYATSSWFVKVTGVKERALETAKEINWTPNHIKEGRFGKWLEGARDWSISRQRFWASVMPIWRCKECGELEVFGSVASLEERSGAKVTDLHKHVVDNITFKCQKCSGEMHRVPDVLDTWFDSGSMPYAQMHYPFENKEKFEANFPAEFIAEGQDQTRAWFYYLHVLGTALKDKPAFKNVIVNGIVLAEDGKKMAKKLQNYPDPSLMFEKYGADSIRMYLMSSPVVAAENLNFKEADVADFMRGTFRMLWNSYSFFVLYADIDKWKPSDQIPNPKSRITNLLDKWILSELNMLIRDYNKHMEAYELNYASRLFPKFIDNLSNWYIRRSRKRFWKSEDDGDKAEAYQTLHFVLVELAKLMAPFAPFMAEEIFKNLTGKESVHLEDMPMADESVINVDMNGDMEYLRNTISSGLRARAEAKIKVRQPLQDVVIIAKESFPEEMKQIICDELNVKKVLVVNDFNNLASEYVVGEESGLRIALNIIITEELKLEGQAREIIRSIQEMRKEAGFEVDNRIKVGYDGLNNVFEKFSSLIQREVLAVDIVAGVIETPDLQKELAIDGKTASISIKKER